MTRAHLGEQVHVYYSEFPAFWEIPGFSWDEPSPPPDAYGRSPNVLEYVNFPSKLGEHFDVMVVDGRYRRRCLLAAKEAVTPGGIVILHDAERTHYHPALSCYPHVEFLQTGPLPGTRHVASVALCGLDDGSRIRQVAEKHRALWHDGR